MTDHTNRNMHELDQRHYVPFFRRLPVALERGEGCYVWDVEGKRYIDALAGIAVNNVGHCHPKVVEALRRQAGKLIHISNFFVSEPQVQLSEKLTEISGMDRVFLTNSGAESVEGAIKIARKYAHSKGRGGKIISFHGAFHGRTLATIATGKTQYQKGFDPIPPGFNQVPFNDIQAVEAVIDQDTAAIIVEPIQGEGGVNPASPEFLERLRRLCDDHDIALIFDEVQCGIGRTGNWFAKDHYGIMPDVMTLAKGLGGGVPIGAFLANEKICSAVDYGDHGTTFGGNPLVCAASLATIQVIGEEDLLKAATKTGKRLRDRLRSMDMKGVKDIRGLGLMIGVEFEFEVKPLVMEMLERGVIANATSGNVLRLVPPLNIGWSDLETVVSVLEAALEAVKIRVS